MSWYDRKGKLIVDDNLFRTDREAYEKQMRDFALVGIDDPKYKIVKQEYLWWGGWLSTVWLGLDHSHGEGKPLIFESMLFYKSWSEIDMDRYSTEKEAFEGHERMKKEWSSVLKIPEILKIILYRLLNKRNY